MSDPFKGMDPELLKKANDRDAELTQTEIDALLLRAQYSEYALFTTDRPEEKGLEGCWMGGKPVMPEKIEWPTFQRYFYLSDRNIELPMHLLLQMNLDHLSANESSIKLPMNGSLLIFAELLCWGDHEGACRVIHVEDDLDYIPTREMPLIPVKKLKEVQNEAFEQYSENPEYTSKVRKICQSRWNIKNFVNYKSYDERKFWNLNFKKAAYQKSRVAEKPECQAFLLGDFDEVLKIKDVSYRRILYLDTTALGLHYGPMYLEILAREKSDGNLDFSDSLILEVH